MITKLPVCKLSVEPSDTVLTTWFERDRAHVCLSWKDKDNEAADTIIEWWDEAVSEAVEDGFLNPRDYHASAFENAQHHGMFAKYEAEIPKIIAHTWPSLVTAFVQVTPAKDRPIDQEARYDWLHEMAETTAAHAMDDLDHNGVNLTPRHREQLSETLTGALYDFAVLSEQPPQPLLVDTKSGPVTLSSDGENLIIRAGRGNLGPDKPFSLPNGPEVSFFTEYAFNPATRELTSLKSECAVGQEFKSPTKAEAAALRKSVNSILQALPNEISDLVHGALEWKAMAALDAAVDRALEAKTSPEAMSTVLRAPMNGYDNARSKRALAFLLNIPGSELEPEAALPRP